MFGAVGSVHAWERVGAALAHLARTFLKLPLLRYVDDYFGPERYLFHVNVTSCVIFIWCVAVPNPWSMRPIVLLG